MAVPRRHPPIQLYAGSGVQKRKSSAAQANSTPVLTPTSTSGTSPARLIENRSKCYKQLADLNSLKESELLTEAEYASECDAILNMLKKLRK